MPTGECLHHSTTAQALFNSMYKRTMSEPLDNTLSRDTSKAVADHPYETSLARSADHDAPNLAYCAARYDKLLRRRMRIRQPLPKQRQVVLHWGASPLQLLSLRHGRHWRSARETEFGTCCKAHSTICFQAPSSRPTKALRASRPATLV